MQKKTLDLVGIGECLVEFAETEPHVYRQNYSGDVLNALYLASALGLHTGLVSSIGDDPFKSELLEVLKQADIDLSAVHYSMDRPNGIYYVLERDGRKAFHFIRKGSAATQTFAGDTRRIEEYLAASRFVLFSAIPLAIMEPRTAMLNVLKRVAGSTTICFDTNVRRALWPDLTLLRDLITELASLVSFLFVSEEDDAALYGQRTPEESLNHYEVLGYSTVILRRGAESTLARVDGRTIEVPVVPGIAAIDPTGAGDAFNAGFIAAQLARKELGSSIAFANGAAASVLGIAGGRAVGVTRNRVEALASQIPMETTT